MPDFDVQVHFHCTSAESFEAEVPSSKPGKTHKVVLGYSRHGNCKFDWSCDCKGFKFRKTCSHIKKAKESEDYCGWQGFVHGGDPIQNAEGEFRCPKCGDEAIPLRYAV
jgi:hypothetical protein